MSGLIEAGDNAVCRAGNRGNHAAGGLLAIDVTYCEACAKIAEDVSSKENQQSC